MDRSIKLEYSEPQSWGILELKFCLASQSLLTANTDVLFSVCPSTHATIQSRREFLAEQLSQLQCAQFSCWLCTHTAQLPPRSGTQAPTPVPLTTAQVSRQHPTVAIGSHPFSTSSSSSSIASAFPISFVWPWVSVLSYQTSLVSSTR